MSENSYTHGGLTAFDLADVANAEADPIGKLFLGPSLGSPKPPQIGRHDILEIGHGASEPPTERSFQERYFLFDGLSDTARGKLVGDALRKRDILMKKAVSERLLKVPVRFIDGKWELPFGGEVPIKDGSFAELAIARDAISNNEFRAKMEKAGRHKVLEEGVSLLVSLTVKSERPPPTNLAPLLRKYDEVSKYIAGGFSGRWTSVAPSFVKIDISGPDDKQSRLYDTKKGGIWLITQGIQAVGLGSTTIQLPKEISPAPVFSLNHAYTILSETFEPWRISHTGNIYSRIFYRELNEKWYPLETLRNIELRRVEQAIAGEFWRSFLEKMQPTSPKGFSNR